MKGLSYPLAKKSVIIIGAETLIGQATGLIAADEGAHVTVVCKKLRSKAQGLIAFPLVSDLAVSELVCDDSYKKLFVNRASLDHLVMVLPGDVSFNTSGKSWEESARHFITTCFNSISTVIKYAMPIMGAGCSISICSGDQSVNPQKSHSPIRCVKEILQVYTKVMSVHLAPVRLNYISGGMAQEFFNSTIAPCPSFVKPGNCDLLVDRFGKPDEMALAIVYLMKHQSIGYLSVWRTE